MDIKDENRQQHEMRAKAYRSFVSIRTTREPQHWKQRIMTVMFQRHLSRFEGYCFHIEDRAFIFTVIWCY